MSKYCFLETNIIAAMGAHARYKINGVIEEITHRFYSEVSGLITKIEMEKELAISSSTVLIELTIRIDKIIGNVLSDYKNTNNINWSSILRRYQYAKILDEFKMQSAENFEVIYSNIKFPPYDNAKAQTLAKEFLDFLLQYYDQYKANKLKKGRIPANPPGPRDAKIIADAFVIKEDYKKDDINVKLYFITMDTFLKDFPDISAFVKKFGFPCLWPSEVLKYPFL